MIDNTNCVITIGAELLAVSEDTRLAYVTYQDLSHLNGLENQTVLAIRAPPVAELNVPEPNGNVSELLQYQWVVFMCHVSANNGMRGRWKLAFSLEQLPLYIELLTLGCRKKKRTNNKSYAEANSQPWSNSYF